MRVVLVHPGAFYATHDVWRGLRDGFLMAGHEVIEYDLGVRISTSSRALEDAWKMAGGKASGRPAPDWANATFHAGHGIYAPIIQHQAEAVVVVTAQFWHPDHTVLIRKAGLPVVNVLTESPYLDEHIAENATIASICLTNERASVPFFKAKAKELHGEHEARVGYLPTAYNPLRHGTGGTRPRPWMSHLDEVEAHDAVLVASGFKERVDLISSTDWSGIDLGLYGDWAMTLPSWLPRNLWTVDARILRRMARLLAPMGGARAARYIRGGVLSNDRAAALYYKARAGVNLWRRSEAYHPDAREAEGWREAESLSPRAYELAAMGCPFVSEPRAELADVFGDLVPTFEGPEELRAALLGLLDDEAGRTDVAVALQERVAAGHTYAHRAEAIVEHIRALSKPPGSHGGAQSIPETP